MDKLRIDRPLIPEPTLQPVRAGPWLQRIVDEKCTALDLLCEVFPRETSFVQNAQRYRTEIGMLSLLEQIAADPEFDETLAALGPSTENYAVVVPVEDKYLSDTIQVDEGELTMVHTVVLLIRDDGRTCAHACSTNDGVTRPDQMDFDPLASAFRIVLACGGLFDSVNVKFPSFPVTFKSRRRRTFSFTDMTTRWAKSPLPLIPENFIGATSMPAATYEASLHDLVAPTAKVAGRAIRVSCSSCDGTEEIVSRGSLLPPEVVAKKFTQKGWTVGKKPVCPTCRSPKETPNMATKPAALPAASPDARKQHRAIMEALLSVFDEDTLRYNDGYTDLRVAEETKAPVDLVTKTREDFFGKLAVPPEMEVLRGLLEEGERALRNFTAQTEDKIQSMQNDLTKVQVLYDNLTKANGWA